MIKADHIQWVIYPIAIASYTVMFKAWAEEFFIDHPDKRITSYLTWFFSCAVASMLYYIVSCILPGIIRSLFKRFKSLWHSHSKWKSFSSSPCFSTILSMGLAIRFLPFALPNSSLNVDIFNLLSVLVMVPGMFMTLIIYEFTIVTYEIESIDSDDDALLSDDTIKG